VDQKHGRPLPAVPHSQLDLADVDSLIHELFEHGGAVPDFGCEDPPVAP
jgi:hypothetical protein